MFTQATIKDVARVAGVHFTTVSMALRGHPAIAVATRTRIETVADTLGYQRNKVFSALSQQRRGYRLRPEIPTILYLGRGRTEADFLIPHHRQLVAGATREAKTLGYQLRAQAVGPASGILPERLQALLSRTNAVGVVIGAWDPTLDVPAINWHEFPVVKIDSRHVPAQVPFVSFDQMKCVVNSFHKVHALGYRRIGLALGEKDEDATDGLHLSGWLVAQNEFPRLAKLPPLFFPPQATQASIQPLLGSWIKKHRLDAILCNWRSIAKMLRALKDPATDRLGCVCLCCSPNEPELAGIVPNFNLVGQRAISLLGSLINTLRNEPSFAPLTCYVEGSWHDGPSLQPKR
ncbi:MAG: LacI family DNA-binding transcriptional regulator [Lacunisphaera sp.]